jgi:hypothetical protein
MIVITWNTSNLRLLRGSFLCLLAASALAPEKVTAGVAPSLSCLNQAQFNFLQNLSSLDLFELAELVGLNELSHQAGASGEWGSAMSLRCLPPDSALTVQEALVELGYAAQSTNAAIQELPQDQGNPASGGGGEADKACVRALRDDLHAMQHTRCGRIVSSPVVPWGFANAFHVMVLQFQRARRLGLTMTWYLPVFVYYDM